MDAYLARSRREARRTMAQPPERGATSRFADWDDRTLDLSIAVAEGEFGQLAQAAEDARQAMVRAGEFLSLLAMERRAREANRTGGSVES